MSPLRDAVERLGQCALNRLRGGPNIERLVAQGLQLGKDVHIGLPMYIDGLHPWLIVFDDYASLSPYVAVITHDASLNQHTGHTRIGRVVVGKRVNVGVGAILLPGTILGEDSVVAAGAVVHGEIPPNSMVIGNPAKVSPVKAVVAWHRASAARAPSWPHEGWTVHTGITEERKREQREALAGASSGYIPAGPAPGSPYALRHERELAPN
jgi:acetyltransferase-like isoleucine patch superfamily enzyme